MHVTSVNMMIIRTQTVQNMLNMYYDMLQAREAEFYKRL